MSTTLLGGLNSTTPTEMSDVVSTGVVRLTLLAGLAELAEGFEAVELAGAALDIWCAKPSEGISRLFLLGAGCGPFCRLALRACRGLPPEETLTWKPPIAATSTLARRLCCGVFTPGDAGLSGNLLSSKCFCPVAAAAPPSTVMGCSVTA